MARITIDDCKQHVKSRFELVLVAAQRGKELNHGAPITIDNHKKAKETIVALREIAAGNLDIEVLKNSLLKKYIVKKNIILESKEKDIDKIKQEATEDMESLKESPKATQEEELYQDEKVIKE